MPSRYAPLTKWLDWRFELGGRENWVDFARIERIIGAELPASARTRRSFWANDVTHTQARSWLSAGFETSSVSLKRQMVKFSFNRRLLETNQENLFLDVLEAVHMPGLPKRIPIHEYKARSVIRERDRTAFETIQEGLARTGGVEIGFYANVHEPPQRGRRTEPGYGRIVIYDRCHPSAPVFLLFADGRIIVVAMLSHPLLRRVSTWPVPRRVAGIQFAVLWQQRQRFLVLWPSQEYRREDDVSLIGALNLDSSATPTECLRVCKWLLREAQTFERGLRKVLYRKRAISPQRAQSLADTYLARYVAPSDGIARSQHHVWNMNPLLLLGADTPPQAAMPSAPSRPIAEAEQRTDAQSPPE
jgi:hypothetical protein